MPEGESLLRVFFQTLKIDDRCIRERFDSSLLSGYHHKISSWNKGTAPSYGAEPVGNDRPPAPPRDTAVGF